MRRLARTLLVVGAAASVVGLSKVHAAWVAPEAYDYTGSSRLGWSLAYIGLLYLAAYGVGLPDLPRTRRAGLVASVQAAVLAALGISAVQLLTGDALLPRFVVFGAALVVVPLGTAANALARRGSDRAEQRDRVVLVGSDGDLTALADELAGAPERPASVVGHLRRAEAGAAGARSLVDVAARADGDRRGPRARLPLPTTTSWPRPPASTSGACGSAPSRCSTRSGWPSSRCPSWSARRCSSTSASCTGPATAA